MQDKKYKSTNWFKTSSTQPGQVQDKFKSVFFVPATPGSKLLNMLKKCEQQHQIAENCRIKFVETSGRKVIDQLRVRDPFEQPCSTNDQCILCQNNDNKASNCKVKNLGYSIICDLCKSRNISKTYEGETCRTGYIRGQEHLKQFKNKSEKSVMYRHVIEDHKNEEESVQFSMKIRGRFKNPMNRQIDEACRIQRKDPKDLLNSKKEYFGPVMSRKVVEIKKAKS